MSQLYARDLVTGTTTLLSATTAGDAAAPAADVTNASFAWEARTEAVFAPGLSPDGRFVVFESLATNLTDTPAPLPVGGLGLFIRGLETGRTTLVAANLARPGGHLHFEAQLNTGASLVAFVDQDPANPVTPIVTLRETATGADLWRATNGVPPLLSADGTRLAYAEDKDGHQTVTVLEVASGGTITASVLPEGEPADPPRDFVPQQLSEDGHIVIFRAGAQQWGSQAPTDLVYWRDLAAKRTVTIGAADIPAMSADGAVLAFVGTGLSVEPERQSVHLWRSATGEAELVSRPDAATTQGWDFAFSSATPGGLSANGQWLSFVSRTGLGPNSPGGAWNVYLRDLRAGANALVSVALDGAGGGDRSSLRPAVSPDGRYVAFLSAATNLTADGGGLAAEADRRDYGLFVRDMQAGTTRLLATNPVGQFTYAFSPDARLLAYAQQGVGVRTLALIGLVEGQPRWQTNLYSPYVAWQLAFSPDSQFLLLEYENNLNRRQIQRLDLRTLRQTNLCLTPFGAASVGLASWPASSADNRYVLFASDAIDLVTATGGSRQVDLYLRDTVGGSNILVTPLTAGKRAGVLANQAPGLSADGRKVVFVTTTAYSSATPADANRYADVFVRDLAANRTILVSVNKDGAGAGNGPSDAAVISADGRFVMFCSGASDLVANDTNGKKDVFLRDLTVGATVRVSLAEGLVGGANLASGRPLLSADGNTAIFHSFATDLVAQPPGWLVNAYAVELHPVVWQDTDGDGLDDDWERRFFGSLARAATDDADRDGASNLAEFLASTDPTDPAAAFRLLAANRRPDGQVEILWAIAPGRFYGVQYRDELTRGAWLDLPGSVRALGRWSSIVDETAASASQRYYRVRLLP